MNERNPQNEQGRSDAFIALKPAADLLVYEMMHFQRGGEISHDAIRESYERIEAYISARELEAQRAKEVKE